MADTGATVVVSALDARLFMPYHAEAVEAIRRLPVRRWDPKQKCWVVPVGLLEQAVRVLAEFFAVEVVDQRQPAPPPAGSARDSTDWAIVLYRALPERLRRPAFLALTKVLHPDVGGDTALMQRLNDAFGTR